MKITNSMAKKRKIDENNNIKYQKSTVALEIEIHESHQTKTICELSNLIFQEDLDNQQNNVEKDLKIKVKTKNMVSKNPYYTPSLRIFKTDIRRSYMAMYFNVINSSDSGLFKSFLQRFCHRDCQWIVNFAPNCFPQRISSFGIDNIIASFRDIHERIPDFSMRFSHECIYLSYHTSTSQITCNCSAFGTKVYDIPFPTILYNAIDFPTSLECIPYVNSTFNSNNIQDLNEKESFQTPIFKRLLPIALSFHLNGKHIMTLDENYHISVLETSFPTCFEYPITIIPPSSFEGTSGN